MILWRAVVVLTKKFTGKNVFKFSHKVSIKNNWRILNQEFRAQFVVKFHPLEKNLAEILKKIKGPKRNLAKIFIIRGQQENYENCINQGLCQQKPAKIYFFLN